MIIFMLYNPGSHTDKSFSMVFKIFILIFKHHGFRADHVFIDLRDAQAAFIVWPGLTFQFFNFGIDKYPLNAWFIRISLIFRFQVLKDYFTID